MVVHLRVVNDNPNAKFKEEVDAAFRKMHTIFKRQYKKLGIGVEYRRRSEFESESEKRKRKRREAALPRVKEEYESTRERPPRDNQ